jgi:hypothetical protein
MRIIRLPALMLAALLPLSAAAIPVTYEYSGIAIPGSGEGGPDGMTFTPVVTGATPFSGFFTIETDTPVTFQDDGYLRYDNAIVAASLSVGVDGALGTFGLSSRPSAPFVTYSSSIAFINDKAFAGNPPYDQFNLNFSLDSVPGAPAGSYTYFYINTGDFTALSLPAGLTLLDPLPIEGLLGSPFFNPGFGYTEYDANGAFLSFANVGVQEFSLRQVAVPEPGTLGLLACGLSVLLLTRRRAHSERARPGSLGGSLPRTSFQS